MLTTFVVISSIIAVCFVISVPESHWRGDKQ